MRFKLKEMSGRILLLDTKTIRRLWEYVGGKFNDDGHIDAVSFCKKFNLVSIKALGGQKK